MARSVTGFGEPPAAGPGGRWPGRPLARAAAGSGGCLAIAFGTIWLAANVLDPNGGDDRYHHWSVLCLYVAFFAVVTALGIMINGVGTAVEQRRARKQTG